MGMLVEGSTRLTLLLQLANGRSAEQVEVVMRGTISWLPASLTRTIAWDQGAEMAKYAEFATATGTRSTSATPTRRGSAAATRTPTACYASTCPGAPTSAWSVARISTRSRTASTPGHAGRRAV